MKSNLSMRKCKTNLLALGSKLLHMYEYYLLWNICCFPVLPVTFIFITKLHITPSTALTRCYFICSSVILLRFSPHDPARQWRILYRIFAVRMKCFLVKPFQLLVDRRKASWGLVDPFALKRKFGSDKSPFYTFLNWNTG